MKKSERIGNMKKIIRPKYHFTPQKGWINDPNGLVFYRGEYHLFYQYNPYHSNWDSMHWGHAVSKDLCCWEEMKPALIPDQPYDMDSEGGCFSGSVIVHEDKMYLFYTGRIMDSEGIVETQNLAISDDGRTFHKVSRNPLISKVPEEGGQDFRDPKVIYAQNKWRMVCGGTSISPDNMQSRGRIYLFSSEDLINWNYDGILYEAEGGEGTMYECPDLFQVEDYWIITASPMYRDDYKTTVYMMGKADFDHCNFRVEQKGTLDSGTHYYAAQSYSDRKGDVWTTAWLGGWLWMPWIKNFGPDEGYRGILDIPRKWFLDEEKYLCARFPEELDCFKNMQREEIYLTLGKNVQIEPTETPIYLKVTVTPENIKDHQLKVQLQDEKKQKVTFFFNWENGQMVADYSCADEHSQYGIRRSWWLRSAETADLLVMIDGNVYTIFAEHGRYRYTGKLHPTGNVGVKVELCKEMVTKYDEKI